MSFAEVLVWLSGPGVAAVVALLLSWAVEYVPSYDALSPKTKRLVFALLCFIVPTAGALFRVLAGYVPFTWNPLLWEAAIAGAAAFGAGTALHTVKLPTSFEAEVARYAIQCYRESKRIGGEQ